MRISQRGLDAIKRHEGLRLHAYPDPATGGEPWTIGYGRAHGVTQGQQISADTAEQYLREDLQWVEDAIKETVTAPLTQGQYDAICSLIYNIGEGAWRGSTMLKRLNERQYMQAAAEFIRWNKANGKVIPGLTNRRVLEQKMFESEGEPEIDTSPEPVQETPKSVHVPPRPDQEPYEAPQPDWPAAAPTYTRPQPEKPNMVAPALPFILGLAGSLIDVFKPLIKEKVSKEMDRHVGNPEISGQLANNLIEAAQRATGKADPIEAVAAARADPAAMTKVEESALEHLQRMAPLLDKLQSMDRERWAADEASRDAASRRAVGDPNDQDRFLTRAIVSIMIGLLITVGLLIGVLAWLQVDSNIIAGLAALFTTLAGGVAGKFSTRFDHRYGSSSGSVAKDAVIHELRRERK